MSRIYLEGLPIPRKLLSIDVDKLSKTMKTSLDPVRREIISDFRKTVRTWDHPVAFRSKVTREGNHLVLRVYTVDTIYLFVNEGTGQYTPGGEPYLIKSKRKKHLTVRVDFTPKTQPGRIEATPGGYGDTVLLRKAVMHPGIRPRKFTEMIQKKHKDSVRKAFRMFLADLAK